MTKYITMKPEQITDALCPHQIRCKAIKEHDDLIKGLQTELEQAEAEAQSKTRNMALQQLAQAVKRAKEAEKQLEEARVDADWNRKCANQNNDERKELKAALEQALADLRLTRHVFGLCMDCGRPAKGEVDSICVHCKETRGG